jgi:hypothetical protein
VHPQRPDRCGAALALLGGPAQARLGFPEPTNFGRFFHREDDTAEVAKGGATGALLGGALGALIAGLTAVGSLAVPGVGVLAAGPIVAALSGTGAGAALGGATGALAKAGFAEADARRFHDELKKGRAVIVVRTDTEEEVIAANDILRGNQAMTKAV